MADQWEKGAGKQKIIEIIPFCLTKNFKENRALRLSGRKKMITSALRDFLVHPI